MRFNHRNLAGMSVSAPMSLSAFARQPVWLEESSATTITADTTAHTKGAWSQLIATTTADSNFMMIVLAGISTNATDTRSLFDIGIGGSGSETVLVANCGGGGASGALVIPVPIFVPKGSRISARLQSLVTGGKTGTAQVILFNITGVRSPSYVETIGADTANSRGVNTPTAATYTQITASTTNAYQALVYIPTGGSGTTWSGATPRSTIATGGSGSEIALGSVVFTTTSNEGVGSSALGFALIPGHVPRGARIAVSPSTSASYQDAIILGVPYS